MILRCPVPLCAAGRLSIFNSQDCSQADPLEGGNQATHWGTPGAAEGAATSPSQGIQGTDHLNADPLKPPSVCFGFQNSGCPDLSLQAAEWRSLLWESRAPQEEGKDLECMSEVPQNGPASHPRVKLRDDTRHLLCRLC